jgi:hypothetical protein
MSDRKTDPISCREAAWEAASGRIEIVRAAALADRDTLEGEDYWARKDISELEQIVAGVIQATPSEKRAAQKELVKRPDATTIGRSGGRRYAL